MSSDAQVTITLPDGSQKQVPAGTTVGDFVRTSIGPGLAKVALYAKYGDKDVDLTAPLDHDDKLSIFTPKNPESLELLRHDAAHIVASAVQRLFPGTQVTIGPATEEGFYYDFFREKPFTPEDLEAIEKAANEQIKLDLPFHRKEVSKDEAIALFTRLGEKFKLEIIEDIFNRGAKTLSLYEHGDWVDFCLGPHSPSTGRVGVIKLLSVAGAYWRGDHRNEMLQRIYGTAWANEKDLDAYLKRIEEAEKRDHRKVGRELDLFHMQEEGKGMVFWHPKGWTVWREVEAYVRRRLNAADYVEVKTPQVLDRVFWEQSGHWEKYRENMFVCETAEEEVLSLKPMNCPGHVQIFKTGQKSYRDLPLRMAEFGACHRYEPSGSLHGLMRVRGFTQDDAHIFCREDQIEAETASFIKLAQSIHSDFGLDTDHISLATRPELRAGSDEFWDKAEAQMLSAARKAGVEPTIAEGDGAFYAPKLDFVIKDAIGRMWTCGTLQLDYVLPERLDAEYVGEDGAKHRPVMLHRAILGSLERFIGIVIEHYAGAFPMWLAPVQVVVATISESAEGYAREAAEKLKAAGLRVAIDVRGEKINYKIREHSLQKVPVIAVVGAKEAEEGKLALRRFGSPAQEVVLLSDAAKFLAVEALAPDLKRAHAGT
jgi:threonyl-tRNA synthetase